MSILARDEILREIEAERIVIEPYDESQVGAASVDLCLGTTFRIFKGARRNVKVTPTSDYRELSVKVEIENGDCLLLMPGETVLGMTLERIRLPSYICGWLEGRTRFARMGLLVHISASFMQPGLYNHQVLELSNFGPNPLELYPGTPICQFVFQKMIGNATYGGQFKEQDATNW